MSWGNLINTDSYIDYSVAKCVFITVWLKRATPPGFRDFNRRFFVVFVVLLGKTFG